MLDVELLEIFNLLDPEAEGLGSIGYFSFEELFCDEDFFSLSSKAGLGVAFLFILLLSSFSLTVFCARSL